MTEPRENAGEMAFANRSAESFATNITGHESHGSSDGRGENTGARGSHESHAPETLTTDRWPRCGCWGRNFAIECGRDAETILFRVSPEYPLEAWDWSAPVQYRFNKTDEDGLYMLVLRRV